MGGPDWWHLGMAQNSVAGNCGNSICSRHPRESDKGVPIHHTGTYGKRWVLQLVSFPCREAARVFACTQIIRHTKIQFLDQYMFGCGDAIWGINYYCSIIFCHLQFWKQRFTSSGNSYSLLYYMRNQYDQRRVDPPDNRGSTHRRFAWRATCVQC